MTTLYRASKEWAERPADQRFDSLESLDRACQDFRGLAREARGVAYQSLRVEASEGDVKLIGKSNVPSSLTHWAFGQLASRVGAPAGYLRDLPATLAAQNLNHGLATARDSGDKCNLLLHQNGGYIVHAFLSSDYTRIWNSDVTSRLLRLREQSPAWQPAPAAFDGSRGLYASDHDMFAFIVDNDRRIFERGPGGGLGRGFFVWNSEVGGSSFGVQSFLYEYVCGNHIIWGASAISELRIRHVGKADDRAFAALGVELRKYADSSASDDELMIERAQRTILGDDKDAVLDRVFGLRLTSRKVADAAFQLAEMHSDRYGDPKSVWGMVNGLTEHSQTLPHMDARVALDRAAGKLLQVAF